MIRIQTLARLLAISTSVSLALGVVSAPTAHSIENGETPADQDVRSRAVVSIFNTAPGAGAGTLCTGTAVANPGEPTSQWVLTARHCLMRAEVEQKSDFTAIYEADFDGGVSTTQKPLAVVEREDRELAAEVRDQVESLQPQWSQIDPGPIIGILAGLGAIGSLIAIIIALAGGGSGSSSAATDSTEEPTPEETPSPTESPKPQLKELVPPSADKPVITNLSITTFDGNRYEAVDIAYPADGSDIAFIQLKSPLVGIRPMTVSRSPVEVGGAVTQYGQAMDRVTRMANGVIARETSLQYVVGTKNPARVLEKPYPVVNLILGEGQQTAQYGDSGGPIFRGDSEEVLAVHSLRSKDLRESKDPLIYEGKAYDHLATWAMLLNGGAMSEWIERVLST
ncbi:trypsin-like peptidase domain-containing protein [Corynebacterium qintianiae]|uniref:Trypsin-like peptidase domain-containing protein n=1 Tax=Corynebacterium qintianiae TaxID=2709392 RepID=A0A7T0PFI8_9CORY|nr:trypsin-like peptidase domain-containing protein [Corynebacterium qintianiae]QPK83022.1 trypsin-like peptidase domain-containing protein [Corynebacterium qintianiae]